jgi:preprotein translocase subunit Sss1
MGSALVGVVIALVVGLFVGSSSQRVKRARLDYQRTRALITAARKLAIDETMRGLRVVAAGLAVIAALGMVMYLAGRQ